MGMGQAIYGRWSQKILLGILRLTLCVVMVGFIVPLAPTLPVAGLDASWVLALGHGLAHGLVYGRDIVFTFGPYSQIYTRGYYPGAALITTVAASYLAVCYLIIFHLLIRSHAVAILIALIVIFSAAFYTRDAIFTSYPLLFAIACFRMVDPQARIQFLTIDSKFGLLLLALLASPFGLFPLIKGSLILICAGTLVLAALLFLSQRKYLAAGVIVGAALVSLGLFWLGAGGALSTLPTYFISMQPIITGYSEAMQNDGPTVEWVAYIVAAVVLLLILVGSLRKQARYSHFLALSYALYLFIIFKSGFVRHVGHAPVASEGLLLAAMYLYFVPRITGTGIAMACAVAFWILVDGGTFNLSSKILFQSPAAVYQNTGGAVVPRVTQDHYLENRFNDSLSKIYQQSKLSKLAGTADIYPWDQAVLLAAGDRWNPRPVFQSYAAYTPSLLLLNRDHLLGPQAPENVFFRVDPIDGRFPSLDDGASWPVLLTRYQVAGIEDGFIQLKRDPSSTSNISDTEQLLSESKQMLGHAVQVPFEEGPLMVSLRFRRTLLGTVANILFKPANLSIAVRLESGEVKNFRMVSGMSETGFLINPMIENTDDMLRLFGNYDALPGRRIVSFVISDPSGRSHWKLQYQVTFKKLVLPAGTGQSAAYRFNQRVDLAATEKQVEKPSCEANIDTIDGVPEHGVRPIGKSVRLDGWGAQSTKLGLLADSMFVVLEDEGGHRSFFSTTKTQRSDVAAYFERKVLDGSGFTATIDAKPFSGLYRLGLALEHDGQLDVCPLSGPWDFRSGITPFHSFESKRVSAPHGAISDGVDCDEAIDSLNGSRQTSAAAVAGSSIDVRGWLVKKAVSGVAADTPIIALTDDKGTNAFYSARKTRRPDVAAKFGHDSLLDAGLYGAIDSLGLSGRYKLRLGFLDADRIGICRMTPLSLSFQ